ncbi:MAG TPA: TetR-like C-terminal domain-containing protein [Aggregatilineales bacterium]|nr:TetR/AcrR family transcriptional regulator [Chloroflexota bacterium]HQA67206.1 TetR-like C-terminal domain-containing protein [Aggregatilineales bacterium]HQE20254.1 TetR-like C-terminal domain-containing protein [Aggregatilineales bacterium]
MAKRRWLTREIVVERAAQMADKAGALDEVTLTVLAADLGVRTPSLYNHVEGLEDLHQALAMYGLRQLIERLRAAAAGLAGREALVAMADAYRRFAREHPGIYPLTLRAPDPGEEALAALGDELLHMLLLVLASVGLHGDDALHAVRGFRALLHGFATLEAAEGFKLSLDRDESFRRALAAYLDGLGCSQS